MDVSMASLQLRCFAVALLLFHSSEFMLAVFYHRCTGVQSLLLTVPYVVAIVAGIGEHTLENWLLPQLKNLPVVTIIGLSLVVLGELIRKVAIITAQSNFTHDIKVDYEEGHELVTHGIYRYVRHPSYLGFFIFAVGTQVMLCNPVSTIVYIVVLWRFFVDRIEYEEYFLVEFFGQNYEDYAEKVLSGIPFVK